MTDPTAQYARIQRRVGVDGPGSEVRVLIDQNAHLTVSCQNGSDQDSGGGEADGLARPSRSVPAVEVADFGSVSGECSTRGTSRVITSELYTVDDTVTVGRIRVNRGKTPGPWQITTPLDGLVFFPIELTGDDAWTRPLTYEIQFLDRNGKQATIQPYGAKGTKATEMQSTPVDTCSSLQTSPKPEKIIPPKSTTTGKAACLAMAADDNPEGGSFLKRNWNAELVVSTKTEWGAVLSDGQQRFGCSLYPTREISQVTADSTALTASAFFFALNPIAASDGSSLWAAGRVPKDVNRITYTLPGGRDVSAQLDGGYWMVKYHVDGADLATGNVSGWDPVLVRVTRPSGTETYQIPFTEKTMCNQVSHGC